MLTDDRLPKGVLTLVTIQIACAIWTRRYTASGAEQGTATPNRIVYRLWAPGLVCKTRDPNSTASSCINSSTAAGSPHSERVDAIVFGSRWSSRMGPQNTHSAQRGVIAGALTCAVCDAYRRRHRRVGRRVRLHGGARGSHFKDWDRLRHGVFDRRTRLVVFAFILGADVLQWALTREAGVSRRVARRRRGGGLVVGCRHSAAAAGAIKFGFYEAPGPARRVPGADFVDVLFVFRTNSSGIPQASPPLGHYQGAVGTAALILAVRPCCHQASVLRRGDRRTR